MTIRKFLSTQWQFWFVSSIFITLLTLASPTTEGTYFPLWFVAAFLVVLWSVFCLHMWAVIWVLWYWLPSILKRDRVEI